MISLHSLGSIDYFSIFWYESENHKDAYKEQVM